MVAHVKIERAARGRGLPDHEARLEIAGQSYGPGLPRWQGEPLAGPLLIYPEQIDIESDAALRDTLLLARGVEISDVFHGADGVYAGPDEPYLFGRIRVNGPDPDHRSYRSFGSFKDPDGNGWLLQEITSRLPGRVAGNTTYASAADLAQALRRAATAHGQHEAQRDAFYFPLAPAKRGRGQG